MGVEAVNAAAKTLSQEVAADPTRKIVASEVEWLVQTAIAKDQIDDDEHQALVRFRQQHQAALTPAAHNRLSDVIKDPSLRSKKAPPPAPVAQDPSIARLAELRAAVDATTQKIAELKVSMGSRTTVSVTQQLADDFWGLSKHRTTAIEGLVTASAEAAELPLAILLAEAAGPEQRLAAIAALRHSIDRVNGVLNDATAHWRLYASRGEPKAPVKPAVVQAKERALALLQNDVQALDNSRAEASQDEQASDAGSAVEALARPPRSDRVMKRSESTSRVAVVPRKPSVNSKQRSASSASGGAPKSGADREGMARARKALSLRRQKAMRAQGTVIAQQQPAVAKPGTQRFSAKEIEQLIQDARDAVGRAAQGDVGGLDFGRFFLAREPFNASAIENWQQAAPRLDAILINQATPAHERRLAAGVEVHARYYYDYVRGQPLMSGLLSGGGGNCMAQTKLFIAAFAKHTFNDGKVLLVQHYKDHIQPVLYDAAAGTVYELISGRTQKAHQIEAPLYRPEYLANGDLRQMDDDGAVSVEALLVKDADIVVNPDVKQPWWRTGLPSPSLGGAGKSNYSADPIPERASMPPPQSERARPAPAAVSTNQAEVESALSEAATTPKDHPSLARLEKAGVADVQRLDPLGFSKRRFVADEDLTAHQREILGVSEADRDAPQLVAWGWGEGEADTVVLFPTAKQRDEYLAQPTAAGRDAYLDQLYEQVEQRSPQRRAYLDVVRAPLDSIDAAGETVLGPYPRRGVWTDKLFVDPSNNRASDPEMRAALAESQQRIIRAPAEHIMAIASVNWPVYFAYALTTGPKWLQSDANTLQGATDARGALLKALADKALFPMHSEANDGGAQAAFGTSTDATTGMLPGSTRLPSHTPDPAGEPVAMALSPQDYLRVLEAIAYSDDMPTKIANIKKGWRRDMVASLGQDATPLSGNISLSEVFVATIDTLGAEGLKPIEGETTTLSGAPLTPENGLLLYRVIHNLIRRGIGIKLNNRDYSIADLRTHARKLAAALHIPHDSEMLGSNAFD